MEARLSYSGAGLVNVCQVRRARPHTSSLDVARAWMDKLLSLVTDPVDDDEICWVVDGRQLLSVVRMTKVVRPGVPSSPAGSMRTT